MSDCFSRLSQLAPVSLFKTASTASKDTFFCSHTSWHSKLRSAPKRHGNIQSIIGDIYVSVMYRYETKCLLQNI